MQINILIKVSAHSYFKNESKDNKITSQQNRNIRIEGRYLNLMKDVDRKEKSHKTTDKITLFS